MSSTTTTRGRRLRHAPLAVGIAAALMLSVAPAAAQATAVTASATDAALYGAGDPTYDGVYRQSLAILGLHAAGITPDAKAVQWLLDQQCDNNGFSSFNADPTQPCAPFDGNTYSGGIDTNATAVAAQALIAVGRTTEGAAAASYLRGLQDGTDFGWEYTAGAGFGSDPNSTGLVLTALDATGLTPITDPAPYFASLQLGHGILTDTDTDEGGIASPYSNSAPDVLATVQSVPGLGGSNLVTVPAPATWADDATVYPLTPPDDVDGITGWAATWLAAQVDVDAVGASNYAWAILSLATTATAKTQATSLYNDLRNATLDIGTNPGALGQAALAATSLGNTADATKFGKLIETTLRTAPRGTYALSDSSVWSTESVKLTRSAIVGDAAAVTQTVAWGDGTTSTGLASAGASLTHTYTSSSTVTRTVTVTLIDGVADRTTTTVGTVKVTKDTVDPTANLTAPATTSAVSSWRTLQGTASDTGLGVKSISVHLIEKRSGSWYAYNGATWSKKSTYTAAKTAAKRITVTPASSGAWTLKVAKLTKGTLKVKYSATDKAGNTSMVKTTAATLTQ